MLVLIVEHERLYGGNHNLCFSPIIYILLKDNYVIIRYQIVLEVFLSLIFKLILSTRKNTRLTFPLRKKRRITAAEVSVLHVPVAISNRNR